MYPYSVPFAQNGQYPTSQDNAQAYANQAAAYNSQAAAYNAHSQAVDYSQMAYGGAQQTFPASTNDPALALINSLTQQYYAPGIQASDNSTSSLGAYASAYAAAAANTGVPTGSVAQWVQSTTPLGLLPFPNPPSFPLSSGNYRQKGSYNKKHNWPWKSSTSSSSTTNISATALSGATGSVVSVGEPWFCEVCDLEVPVTSKEEHLASNRHQKRLKTEIPCDVCGVRVTADNFSEHARGKKHLQRLRSRNSGEAPPQPGRLRAMGQSQAPVQVDEKIIRMMGPWKPGQGLGRENQGTVEPLSATIKGRTTGSSAGLVAEGEEAKKRDKRMRQVHYPTFSSSPTPLALGKSSPEPSAADAVAGWVVTTSPKLTVAVIILSSHGLSAWILAWIGHIPDNALHCTALGSVPLGRG